MENVEIYCHRMAIQSGHHIHAVFRFSEKYIMDNEKYFSFNVRGFFNDRFVKAIHQGLFKGEPHLLPPKSMNIDITQGVNIQYGKIMSCMIVDIPIIENTAQSLKSSSISNEQIRRVSENILMNIAESIDFQGSIEVTIYKNDMASNIQFFKEISELKKEDNDGI